MEISIFIAKLLALMYLSLGVGMLVNRDHYDRLFKAVSEHTPALYFGGILALLFGYFIVSFHNLWVNDWRVVVTIFGWIGLVKGVSLLAIPNTMKRMTESLMGMKHFMKIETVFVLIFGVFFVYFGFRG